MMSTFVAEMRNQSAGVARHFRRGVAYRIVRLVTFAMPAIINRDDLTACFGQKIDPAGGLPVDPHIRGKSVDQQYRFTDPVHLIGNIDVI